MEMKVFGQILRCDAAISAGRPKNTELFHIKSVILKMIAREYIYP